MDPRGEAPPPDNQELRFAGRAITYFGNYALLGEAGRGGMGVVYYGRELDLNREVAVKLLHPARFASAEAGQRFRREAEALARLDHPNIVRIYDVGAVNGQPYLAMKWAAGDSLAQRLLEQSTVTPASPPDTRAAARLVAQVAGAVQHAHERDVLHRDLKPANILLEEDGTPLVADFGVAHLADEPGQPSARSGTPHYMAPEQAAGDPQAGAAADLFSLGVILYELITRQRPFAGDTRPAILAAVQAANPPPPRALNPAVDRDLEAICLKCLEKDPAARYASAAALADDLGHWLRHEPVRVRPATRLERTAKWTRRNPVAATLLGLLLVVLFGSLASLTWQRRTVDDIQAQSSQTTERLADTETLRAQREAEAKFESERGREGVAILTRLLSQRPDNDELAARLFSALSFREAAWPLHPPLRHDGEVRFAAFLPDRQRVFTAADDGWLRLWTSTNAALLARFPHETQRGRFALSPDGLWVATLATNGGAAVWPVDGARPAFLISRPAALAPVVDLDFSADDRWLAAGLADGRFELWSLADGARLASADHGEPLRRVRFNPAGGQLLTVGATACKLWPVPTGTASAPPAWAEPARVLRPTGRPLTAEFSPTGDRLLTMTAQHIEVWPTNSTAPAAQFPFLSPGAELTAAAFGPGGKNIAAGTRDGRVYYQTGTNRFVRILRSADPSARINAVRFTPNNTFLLPAGADGSVKPINPRTRTQTLEPITSSHPVHDAIPTPDGGGVLTLGADGTARSWHLSRPVNQALSWAPVPAVRRVELSPSGRVAATILEDDTIALVSTSTLQLNGLTARTPAPLSAVAFSETDPWLAAADEAGNLFLHDARDGSLLRGPLPHAVPITRLLWASRAPVLACVSSNGVTAWDVAGLLATQPPPGGANPAPSSTPLLRREFARLSTAAVAPDGRQLALAAGDSGAWLFDLTPGGTGASRHVATHDDIQRLAFSPDGKQLATAAGVVASVWDTATGQPCSPPIRAPASITCLAFSPAASTLLTGGMDGRLVLWNVASGAMTGDLPEHRAQVLSVAFSPDGRWVASSGADDQVRLASVASGLPVIQYVSTSALPVVRYEPSGEWLKVTTTGRQALLIRSPVVAKPPRELLIALAEFHLGQRLDERGQWHELTTAEFLERRQRIATIGARLGPPPPVRIYH